MSRLEEKVLNGLSAVGYNGLLMQKPNFPMAIEGGPKSVEYTKLVNYLTNEIRTLLEIDEEVNTINAPEDAVAFIMEVTSFLKELNCPYSALTQGHVSDRLQNVGDRLLLLDYLITELMGARILQEKKPSKKIELKLKETPEGKDMRLILQTLRFPKPPANISVKTLFDKLCPTIPIVLEKAGADIVGRGIFNGHLSEKQWQVLNDMQEDMNKEYKIRREMLLTRLDCTIQSFQWSDKTKGKDDMFEKIYHDKRRLLKVDPDVDIADLIAARTDVAIIEKTSNASVRKFTKTQLNKVIIGRVPDRGGRTTEIAPPPPEMPSWQQRQPGGGGGFGGRGGGGDRGRGGGRGRGSDNYSRGGNSYSAGGGGGYQHQNYSANKSFDSVGSYDNKFDNQNRGGYNQGNRSYDNKGGYDNQNRAGGYDNQSYSQNRNSYDRGGSGFDNQNRGYDSGRSSHGGQGGGSYDRFESNRANKQTYADQYVQESHHNQQYQRGGGGGGRGGGRSNYQRGGGRGR
ncbi:unnamed protein product [Acanthoscelides obtectus]|uniref:Protein FAM98A n=1 Tax=Acanthoscelides obtectus TaxID=200917 RepID=A0A9P0QEA0_ACAOB|nr:unnamed protein product [Acanthoscelides obtectus]CAK1658537.1 Protein FAM98A [Acanthoscelides obtectus]